MPTRPCGHVDVNADVRYGNVGRKKSINAPSNGKM